MSVLVVGAPEALALAGAPAPAGPPSLVVALDDAAFPAGAAPRLRWWRTPAPPASAGERVAAPAGEALWSRSPWPVRDELFALAAGGAGVLVVAADPAPLVADLAARGIAAAGADSLTAAALEAAGVVVCDSATPPGDAFAVLAAGRLLIATAEPAFGLVAGLDHLHAEAPEHAADLVQAVLADPAPFAAMRAFGRIAAERHRASAVYARLLDEA